MTEIFIKPAPTEYQPFFIDHISIIWNYEVELIFNLSAFKITFDQDYSYIRRSAMFRTHKHISKHIGMVQRRMREDFVEIQHSPVGCFYLDTYNTECLLWTTGIISREYAMSFMVERCVDPRYYKIYDI